MKQKLFIGLAPPPFDFLPLLSVLYSHFVQVVVVILVQFVPLLVERPEAVHRIQVRTPVAGEREKNKIRID